MRWVAAAAGFVALLIGAVLLAGPAAAVGPYPALGPCPVFPDPPASLSPQAPSLPTEAAWNQDVSQAPRDPRSSAYIAYINSHGGDHLHPDFGSPRPYGFPYAVVDAGQPQLPIHYTAYGSESDPGPFPVPAKAPVEGGNGSDDDRHVLVVDRSACKLYELYRASTSPSRARTGTPTPEPSGTCAPPPADPTAGPPPTPPACRSSPASSATTRSPAAASTTRSASPSRAPATPGSTPPPTAPATPPTRTRRRWACGCG